jgi:hypothetical protein
MHLLLDYEIPKSDLQIATTNNIARSLSQDPAKAKNISMGSPKFRLLVTRSNTDTLSLLGASSLLPNQNQSRPRRPLAQERDGKGMMILKTQTEPRASRASHISNTNTAATNSPTRTRRTLAFGVVKQRSTLTHPTGPAPLNIQCTCPTQDTT